VKDNKISGGAMVKEEWPQNEAKGKFFLSIANNAILTFNLVFSSIFVKWAHWLKEA
jgi:hypothetical protein